MFTGIIEGLGTITGVRPSGQGKRLIVTADFPLNETKIGDSISISGACLTAVVIQDNRFEVDVSPETLARTTFGQVKIGDRVNIERALRLSDRLDGHLVSGHIDGLGTISDKKKDANAVIITFRVPETLSGYLIEKGSVAVDGISLTINHCSTDSFDVSIIPHTAKLTTVGFKAVGDAVNIETDMIGKYIEKFMKKTADSNSRERSGKPVVDKEFLAKTGFIK